MRYFLSFIIVCVLGGCQMRLDYPKDVAINEIETVSNLSEKRPIALRKVGVDIKRGSIIAAYPFFRFLFPNVHVGLSRMCNATLRYRLSRSTYEWNHFQNVLGNWDFDITDYVEEPLQEMGYDVVSARGSAFRYDEQQMRAELVMAATVKDIRMNVCHIWDMLDFRADLNGGDAYVDVEWEIYDPLRKRIVGVIKTKGIGFVDDPIQGGVETMLLNALQDAARNLGHSKEFYQIVMNEHYQPRKNPNGYGRLEIDAKKKPFIKPIGDHFNFTRRAVVTVRSNNGHGSGFFINEDGYALTNAHVVGEAKTVAIVDASGVQYMADVLRTDEERDVALIKADITRNNYFPISKEKVQITQTVYAIGTPLTESIKTTISKGIISAHRYRSKQDLSFYQADVEIAPGSSGGPLVDKFGNVIGMAVKAYGLGEKETGSSFGLFIPIKDALRALNIEIVQPERPVE